MRFTDEEKEALCEEAWAVYCWYVRVDPVEWGHTDHGWHAARGIEAMAGVVHGAIQGRDDGEYCCPECNP